MHFSHFFFFCFQQRVRKRSGWGETSGASGQVSRLRDPAASFHRSVEEGGRKRCRWARVNVCSFHCMTGKVWEKQTGTHKQGSEEYVHKDNQNRNAGRQMEPLKVPWTLEWTVMLKVKTHNWVILKGINYDDIHFFLIYVQKNIIFTFIYKWCWFICDTCCSSRGVLVQTWAAQFHFSNLRSMQMADKKAKGDAIEQVSIAQSHRDVCIHVSWIITAEPQLHCKKRWVVKYFMQK